MKRVETISCCFWVGKDQNMIPWYLRSLVKCYIFKPKTKRRTKIFTLLAGYQWCYLTNRFHVVVRLFSNRSPMTSKCGKNKKVAHEAYTDVLTTFWRLLWSITESDARQHGIDLFYIITESLFYFKILQQNARESWLFAPPLPRLWFARKKAIWRDHDLYKMKQFHWLLCVAKNCDWSRKVAPLSNMTPA